MPENRPAHRVCPNCDGFPVVAISIGIRRLTNGNLPTLTVECRECSGTGTVPAPIGRAAALPSGR